MLWCLAVSASSRASQRVTSDMGLPRAGIGIVLFLLFLTYTTLAAVILPNTSGIDGQLTANHKVDHFFSLWMVFNNEEVKMSGQ